MEPAPAPVMGGYYETLATEMIRDPAMRALLDSFRDRKTILCSASERAAKMHRRQHGRVVVLAGVFGTLAVVCAMAQLSGRFGSIPFWCELAAVVLASLTVVVGIVRRHHHWWLLHRHKAERCHLLHWGLLTKPSLWDPGNPARQRQAIDGTLAALKGLESTEYRLDDWVEEEGAPVPPRGPSPPPPPSLRAAYLRDRLSDQQKYFSDASRRNQRLQNASKPVAVVAFFGSALVGLGHFGLDAYEHLDHGEGAGVTVSGVSLAFLLVSASVPVIAGAVRVVRDAFEPARNTVRFRQHAKALQRLATRIADATDAELGGELWAAEFVLESEHRAWLMLMTEAEWFG